MNLNTIGLVVGVILALAASAASRGLQFKDLRETKNYYVWRICQAGQILGLAIVAINCFLLYWGQR